MIRLSPLNSAQNMIEFPDFRKGFAPWINNQSSKPPCDSVLLIDFTAVTIIAQHILLYYNIHNMITDRIVLKKTGCSH